MSEPTGPHDHEPKHTEHTGHEPLAGNAADADPSHDGDDLGSPGDLGSEDDLARDTNKLMEAEESVPKQTPQQLTRRTLLFSLGVALNGAVALAIATPVVAYLLGPILRRKEYRHWIEIGAVSDYKSGETRLIDYENPFRDPWDGDTAKIPAYVRVSSTNEIKVFAINCAHLGCPVRWFSESQLFMCPCHGGVYYADGARAAGPPPRGLYTYESKVVNGKLMIDAGQMPTLSNRASVSPCEKKPSVYPDAHASLVTRITPCAGTDAPTIG